MHDDLILMINTNLDERYLQFKKWLDKTHFYELACSLWWVLILAVCLSSQKSYWLLCYYQWKAAALRAGVQSSIFVRRALPGSIYSVILFISVTLRYITALKRIVSVVSLDIRFNFRLSTVQLDTLNSHTILGLIFSLSLSQMHWTVVCN